ncbi:TPA: tetratricopeptide repeat protein [Burkholderia territorii]|uniref:tetratricopeptide repeat protein n=2 Tax=Burkholderia territorii TaxID=1503055 RepID=UPI0011C8DB45|nr:tetratricopeptide repeat protein [Burkholderia territorii]TXG23985.1 tetratricopeptide repeat protein [Burkholderia territorii]HDR8856032.1 tetratricopeptide repeat protein [Burkholderia territorii]HDR8863153.1 tetratricopeptide repeat protein [Burkholderia territorii]HDR8869447.1 tetratricopeptide repeat protein [Burkholderia territorii]HDR8876344.1 tetratricopeptide repeat protein [Burkholderia territorii]
MPIGRSGPPGRSVGKYVFSVSFRVMDSAFDRAYAAHRAGHLAEAEHGYRAALATNPADADALHLFGVLRHQQGQHAEAADLVGRAVELRPNDAALQLNLGNALKALGRLDEAIDRFRNALTLAPEFPLAHYNLGNAYAALQRHEDALDAFGRALELTPDDASIHNNLGNALNALGRHDDAIAAFRRALELRPGHAGAHNNLAMALNAIGRADDAIAHFQAAIAAQPRFVAAHFNLGNTFEALGRHGEAAAAFEAALALHPPFPLALFGLANALCAQARHREALPYYERAVGLDPSFGLAWLNLGNAHHALGAHEMALRAFDQALRVAPDLKLAHLHRAVTLLTLGDFTRGLPAYEARHDTPGATSLGTLPRWQGEPITSRTLLIRAEQGFGDTLQFVRFVPLVRERCARVVLEVQPELVTLLTPAAARWRVTLVAQGAAKPPAADIACTLMSLPFLLGLQPADIVAGRRYLDVPDSARRRFRGSLGGQSKRKFGLAWSGRRQAQENRSMPFDALAPLLALSDIDWIVLQPALDEDERARVDAHPRVHRLDGRLNDFAETAALIERLDGVVTIDTAVAHLAGALGKPLWIMLPFAADWRWFTGDDCPWYPHARLVRQSATGQWLDVAAAVAAALRDA